MATGDHYSFIFAVAMIVGSEELCWQLPLPRRITMKHDCFSINILVIVVTDYGPSVVQHANWELTSWKLSGRINKQIALHIAHMYSSCRNYIDEIYWKHQNHADCCSYWIGGSYLSYICTDSTIYHTAIQKQSIEWLSMSVDIDIRSNYMFTGVIRFCRHQHLIL